MSHACSDPKLPSLLKMLVWAQQQLGEKVNFPKMTNLATAELEDVMDTTESVGA